MNQPLIKYNPAFLSEQELEQAFVIRQKDLLQILGTIRRNTGAINRHILLIGARGMGKTMLVRRTAAYVKNDHHLGKQWYPILFSEESYEVSSAAEFWLKAVYHLGIQTGDRGMQTLHAQLREETDDQRLQENVLQTLMTFAQQEDKRLLVMVENLNMILDHQMAPDQSWLIRQTLQSEPRLMLLGTSPTYFAEIDDPERAMYDLFDHHPLEPLETEDAAALWRWLSGKPVSHHKIRPLQILTGGNPRLLAIISRSAAHTGFRELMAQLTVLIDDYTNYFKGSIESLPPLERKVFVTLANIWEPATAKRVAAEARIMVNKASSLLKRLENRGTVSVVKTEQGKKSYQVTERLYNIYHLMRNSGAQSNRVRAVVEFMVNVYDHQNETETIPAPSGPGLFPDYRQADDHDRIPAILKKVNTVTGDRPLPARCHRQWVEPPELCDGLTTEIERMVSRAYAEEKSIDLQVDKLWQDRDYAVIPVHFNKADIYVMLGEYYQYVLKNNEEAEAAFIKATQLDAAAPAAWERLGYFYLRADNTDNALETLKKAHVTAPEDAGILNNLGTAFGATGNETGAEEAYRKAADLDPAFKIAWANLARLLAQQGRFREGEWAYQQGLEIDPQQETMLLGLAQLYAEHDRHRQSLAAYQKVLAMKPSMPAAWTGLGMLYLNTKKIDEAEKALQRAIQCDPETTEIRVVLAIIYAECGKEQLAEAAFRVAIAGEPDNDAYKIAYGDFLYNTLNRFQQAETVVREALTRSPVSLTGWRLMLKLLRRKRAGAEEVTAVLDELISTGNRTKELLNELAWAIFDLDYRELLPLAETLARDAFTMAPRNPFFSHTLASILGAGNKWPEALTLSNDFVTDASYAQASPEDYIQFFTSAAAAGFGRLSLQTLGQSAAAVHLEPLTAALQMDNDQEINAPQEVTEIAKDLCMRIRQNRGHH